MGATIFVLYLSFDRPPESMTWNGLFWILQLFICINAVAKSFVGEPRGRQLYYGSLVNPQAYVLSKLFFHMLLMILMSGTSYLLFSLFLGNPVLQFKVYLGIALLGGLSLSLVFTFLAAIAAQAQQNAAIMAILGFPIIIPQLIMLLRISSAAFSSSGAIPLLPVLLLVVMDILVVLLACILFPFLWKD